MVVPGMSDVLTLPVLPLDDAVVLPGMVVPVRLDDSDTRAAVDAATAAAQDRDDGRRVLVVPRIDGRYGAIGVVAVLEQIGRLPNGDRATVVRGERRARIGSGVSGPGAALWVEAEPIEAGAPTGRTQRSSPASTRPWSSASCSSGAPGR